MLGFSGREDLKKKLPGRHKSWFLWRRLGIQAVPGRHGKQAALGAFASPGGKAPRSFHGRLGAIFIPYFFIYTQWISGEAWVKIRGGGGRLVDVWGSSGILCKPKITALGMLVAPRCQRAQANELQVSRIKYLWYTPWAKRWPVSKARQQDASKKARHVHAKSSCYYLRACTLFMMKRNEYTERRNWCLCM
jgi:hypothetical protein